MDTLGARPRNCSPSGVDATASGRESDAIDLLRRALDLSPFEARGGGCGRCPLGRPVPHRSAGRGRRPPRGATRPRGRDRRSALELRARLIDIDRLLMGHSATSEPPEVDGVGGHARESASLGDRTGALEATFEPGAARVRDEPVRRRGRPVPGGVDAATDPPTADHHRRGTIESPRMPFGWAPPRWRCCSDAFQRAGLGGSDEFGFEFEADELVILAQLGRDGEAEHVASAMGERLQRTSHPFMRTYIALRRSEAALLGASLPEPVPLPHIEDSSGPAPDRWGSWLRLIAAGLRLSRRRTWSDRRPQLDLITSVNDLVDPEVPMEMVRLRGRIASARGDHDEGIMLTARAVAMADGYQSIVGSGRRPTRYRPGVDRGRPTHRCGRARRRGARSVPAEGRRGGGAPSRDAPWGPPLGFDDPRQRSPRAFAGRPVQKRMCGFAGALSPSDAADAWEGNHGRLNCRRGQPPSP